jgi:predicted XRE-type DNA-binding protein
MSKKHMGSSIDDFLKEEGIFEEAQAQAVKEVVAWQLAQAMKEKKISKNRMATLLKTSRTQVDRLLDARNDITLSSLERAAAMVGRRVTIQLVGAGARDPGKARLNARKHEVARADQGRLQALRRVGEAVDAVGLYERVLVPSRNARRPTGRS